MWFLMIRETIISMYLAMSWNFHNFWGLKMRFAQSWNTHFKCTKFRVSEFSVLPILPHYGSLKIRFLPIRETKVSRYLAKIGNFLNFWGLNMGFALSWNPCCKDTKFRIIKFSAFWQAEHAISADSWNQRFKVPRKDGGNFINFWVLKMRFCRVVKSTIKGYQASCEQIFHVLVVWNYDFCRFVKPTFQGTSRRV